MRRLLHLLVLSDTHLGFDEPLRPRSGRPRRGADFFANFHRVLDAARAGQADAVIHLGDLYYRSRVPDSLVDRAMAPLVELADAGIPVFLVPGNHERSSLPRTLFSAHDRIHIFHEPRTIRLAVDGCSVAFGGFPFVRERARDEFARLAAATGLLAEPSNLRLLCIHQVVEGARVGPSGYQFRGGEDVVRVSDLPGGLTAILSGHIHRHQVLQVDPSGRRLSAPVIYPGSIERTSFAEMRESKGFVWLRAGPAGSPEPGLRTIEFRGLPTRPMYERTLDAGSVRAALARFTSSLEGLEANGILRVRLPSEAVSQHAQLAAFVRAIVPPTMVVGFSLRGGSERSSGPPAS